MSGSDFHIATNRFPSSPFTADKNNGTPSTTDAIAGSRPPASSKTGGNEDKSEPPSAIEATTNGPRGSNATELTTETLGTDDTWSKDSGKTLYTMKSNDAPVPTANTNATLTLEDSSSEEDDEDWWATKFATPSQSVQSQSAHGTPSQSNDKSTRRKLKYEKAATGTPSSVASTGSYKKKEKPKMGVYIWGPYNMGSPSGEKGEAHVAGVFVTVTKGLDANGLPMNCSENKSFEWFHIGAMKGSTEFPIPQYVSAFKLTEKNILRHVDVEGKPIAVWDPDPAKRATQTYAYEVKTLFIPLRMDPAIHETLLDIAEEICETAKYYKYTKYGDPGRIEVEMKGTNEVFQGTTKTITELVGEMGCDHVYTLAHPEEGQGTRGQRLVWMRNGNVNKEARKEIAPKGKWTVSLTRLFQPPKASWLKPEIRESLKRGHQEQGTAQNEGQENGGANKNTKRAKYNNMAIASAQQKPAGGNPPAGSA